MIDVDLSDLNTLAADLAVAGATAGLRIVRVLEESASRIEADAKLFAPRKRLPRYAGTINHAVTVHPGMVEAEIGADADVNGQAKLAPIFEYGTATNAPEAHHGPAFDREVPNFVTKVADVGGQLL